MTLRIPFDQALKGAHNEIGTHEYSIELGESGESEFP